MDIPLNVRSFVYNLEIPCVRNVYDADVDQSRRAGVFYGGGCSTGLTAAVSLFHVPNDFDNMHRLRMHKYLYHHGCHAPKYTPRDPELEAQLVEMFANTEDNEVKFEIADILTTFGSPTGRHMLELLGGRRQRAQNRPVQLNANDVRNVVDQAGRRVGRKIRTVYDDGQNVHDTQVNDATTRAGKYLCRYFGPLRLWIPCCRQKDGLPCVTSEHVAPRHRSDEELAQIDIIDLSCSVCEKKYSGYDIEDRKCMTCKRHTCKDCTDEERKKRVQYSKDYDAVNMLAVGVRLCARSPRDTAVIKSVLTRITQENATFCIGLTLRQIFGALWVWIHTHEHTDGLLDRTIDEIKEMKGYCSTGHLARIINIMQGFTDDPNLVIRISNEDQVEASVSRFLTTELQKPENEEASDALIMQINIQNFHKFVIRVINEKLPEWIREYGDVYQFVRNAVCKYTQNTNYKIVDEEIEVDGEKRKRKALKLDNLYEPIS